MSRFLEDWQLGEEIITKGRTIGEGDVSRFAGLTGDFHRNHTDAEYMRKTQFGKRIVHGLFALAISHGLLEQHGVLENTIAFLEIKDWKFQSPIFFEDTVHVKAVVTDIKESKSKPDRGVVTLKLEVINQHGVICQSGSKLLMVKKRNAK